MKFFCDTLTSDSVVDRLGSKITAALIDPILLPKQMDNIQVRLRPQTPKPTVPFRLSPIENGNQEKKKKRNRSLNNQLVVIENPLLRRPEPYGRLKPIEHKSSRIRQSSWGSSEQNSPIPVHDFYEKIEAAVAVSDADACSNLASRPEMKKLDAAELLELLESSYNRYEVSSASKELFIELFEDIVDKIIPEIHPNYFKNFIILAARKTVPLKLFSMACKHLKLLSKDSLNELVKEIEVEYVLERFELIGLSDLIS